jgi:hypothetical protein
VSYVIGKRGKNAKKSRSGQLDLDGHGDEQMMGLTSSHTCICATYTGKQPAESRGNGTLRPTGHDGRHIPKWLSSYLFREVKNAFIAKWLSTTLSQKSIRWPWGPNDPTRMCNICSSPEYVAGGWKIQYPLSFRLKGTLVIGRLNLMSRSEFEPTVRIDICVCTMFPVNFSAKCKMLLLQNG